MTVKELIEKLQTLPQDAPVVYRFCSEWTLLDEEQVDIMTAEEKGVINDGGMNYMNYRPEWGPIGGEKSVMLKKTEKSGSCFVTTVIAG